MTNLTASTNRFRIVTRAILVATLIALLFGDSGRFTIAPEAQQLFDGLSPVSPSGLTAHFYSGPPVRIPETAAGRDVYLNVANVGVITDVNFRFDFGAGTCDATIGNTNAAVNHPAIGALTFKLTPPDGAPTVVFQNQRGGVSRNICASTLDDEGGWPNISTLGSNINTAQAGNFTPEVGNPLSLLDGENGSGTWTLNVSDNTANGEAGLIRRFSLALDTAGPPVDTLFAGVHQIDIPIPDNNPAGVNIPVRVSGVGTISDFNFKFDNNGETCSVGATTSGISHNRIGDLIFKITPPDGSPTLTFQNQRGGLRRDICNSTIDDDNGPPNIATLTSVAGEPQTGRFAPEVGAAFSQFDGENANGTWILNVSDNVSGGAGVVRHFSLVFGRTQPTRPVSVNPVKDSGFERNTGGPANNPYWGSTSEAFQTSLCTVGWCGNVTQPFNGGGWVWLGGTAATENGFAWQDVRIPTGINPRLKFFMRASAVASPFNSFVSVTVDNRFIYEFQEPATAEGTYTQRSLSLPPELANGSVRRVQFKYFNPPDSGVSSFVVDQVEVEVSSTRPTPYDYDGDGRTDVSIYRPSNGQWWLNRSQTGTIVYTFGASTDKIMPGDYTGDGRTDVTFFRPSNGNWFVLRSEDASFYSFPFGTSTDVPTQGDFDGDRISDQAIFRPSNGTWFVLRSSDAQTSIVQFGVNGDIPVPADYDGDGRTDIAIYRPSNGQWWISRTGGDGIIAYSFGSSTDKPTPGDFTGDSKADVAFWRPSTGTWFVLRSENSSFYSFPFGTPTDRPAPGDYDGDGKFDAAVMRQSTGTWYILRSGDSGTTILPFGSSTDLPTPGASIP